MVNSRFMGYDPENGTTLITISGKRTRRLMFGLEIEKK